MTIRKILYGYRIQNGTLEIVPEEQKVVCRLFTLYLAGASYQRISDALNHDNIPYSTEAPLWNKHKVKRLLENPRYTGRDGYPVIVEQDIFQEAHQKIAEKASHMQPRSEKSIIEQLAPYFRCICGEKMIRLGGERHDPLKQYLRCRRCNKTVTIGEDEMMHEITQQFYAHEHTGQIGYVPSAEVIRFNNAINRGLEQPDSPDAVVSLILRGAAARYACCPSPVQYENIDRPLDVDLHHFQRAVSYITVDNTVTLKFTDDK